MTCKLCQEDKELKKSHIIPKCFYKSVRGTKNRLFIIKEDNKNTKPTQDGIKEKLLCGECEQKFSNWESTLKQTIKEIGDKESKVLKFTDLDINHRVFKVENIKYDKFKLGVLSILWRMSVSSNENFKEYKLGAHEEKLRILLNNESHIEEKKYSIMLLRYEIDKKFHPGFIAMYSPERCESKFIIQNFAIWGHHFCIYLNDGELPKGASIDFFLRNNGELTIMPMELPEKVSHNNLFSKLNDEDVKELFKKIS